MNEFVNIAINCTKLNTEKNEFFENENSISELYDNMKQSNTCIIEGGTGNI